MPFEFGDVVLVPLPFTSQAGTKQRPGVIVSNLAYNNARPDVVLMAITSQFRPSPALGELWLSHWQQAGLLKPSAVKPVLRRWNSGSSSAGSAGCSKRIRPHCAASSENS